MKTANTSFSPKKWLALAALGLPLSVSAADFDSLDANQDGVIEPVEAYANKALTGQWDALDSNGDRVIDQAEFARFETAPAESDPQAIEEAE